MSPHDAESSGRRLDDKYDRLKREGKARGQDEEQAKRDAAETVHRERREEAHPDKQRDSE
jgi:hypothetical protein